ncbi:hypothetical protein ES703_104431 [subsurface metagenome]
MAISSMIVLGVVGLVALGFVSGIIDAELELRRRKKNKGE